MSSDEKSKKSEKISIKVGNVKAGRNANIVGSIGNDSSQEVDRDISIEAKDVEAEGDVNAVGRIDLAPSANIGDMISKLLGGVASNLPAEKADMISADTVFISYSRKDWEAHVKPLVALLRSHGIKLWLDQDLIQGGDDWMDALEKALEECGRLVLCMSPDSLESPWVKREYRHFIKAKKTVYPLKCGEIGQLPPMLDPIQYLPYDETGLAKLITQLKNG